jgi:hypothetical protein
MRAFHETPITPHLVQRDFLRRDHIGGDLGQEFAGSRPRL